VRPALDAMSASGAGKEAVRDAVKTVFVYLSNCLDRCAR
jgi:hypothetical protein